MIELKHKNGVLYVDKIHSIEITHRPINFGYCGPFMRSPAPIEDNYYVHVNGEHCFADTKDSCEQWVSKIL